MPVTPDPIDSTPIFTNWLGGRTLDYVGLLNDRPAYTYGDERIYWNGTVWGLHNMASGSDVLYHSSSEDVFYPWEVSAWSAASAPDGTYIISGQTIFVQLFVEPTATPIEPSSTPVEPTATPVEPTATPVEPAVTGVEPTLTPVEPTATPIEPSSTPVEPTATPVEPTATPVEPAVTGVEPTLTPAPTETPVPTPTPNGGIAEYVIMPGTYDHEQAYVLPNNTQANIYLNWYFDVLKPIGIFIGSTGDEMSVPAGYQYNKAVFIRDSEFLPGQDGIISVASGDTLTFRSIILLGSEPPPTPTPTPTPIPTPRPVLPPEYVNRGGTTYNASIETYEDLSHRIQRQLGAPLINLEISDEQIYDNITDSIEYFTKWAGYTEEYLVFDSRLYIPGAGIKVDSLINKTSEMRNSGTPSLSAGYDYDLASWRKVVDCFEFSKGEDTGINTLFTLEQAMAQQIYSSYMIGNFGFDLVTWEVLKGFIDTRNKVLAMQSQFRFDPRTQMLRILPEPQKNHTYLGIVGCYIERPIKDLIKERWVQKYALALSKIAIARVREKFTGTNMFGGGQVNSQTLLAEGIKEKETLEQELMNSYQDNLPPTFFIGVLTALTVPAFLFAQNLLNVFC